MNVWRTQKRNLMRAQQHACAIRAGHQYMQRTQLMIQSGTQKSNADHNRGRDMAQGLVKIGAVLLRYVETAIFCGQRKRFWRYTIEIAYDRIQRDTRAPRQLAPAICRHAARGNSQRFGHIRG